MNLRYYRILSILLSGAILLSSCGDSPSDPGTATIVKPGIGSTFTMAGYSTDADGAVIESTRDTATYTLNTIHPSLKGQSNVYEFGSSIGPTFLAYADNGDFLLLFQLNLNGGVRDSVWLQMPISSGVEVNKELYRNEQVTGGMGIVSTVTYKGKRGDARNITIGSKSFSARHCEGVLELKTEYLTAGTPSTSFSLYNNIVLDFIPEIGYIAWQKVSITDDPANSSGPSLYGELINYELK